MAELLAPKIGEIRKHLDPLIYEAWNGFEWVRVDEHSNEFRAWLSGQPFIFPAAEMSGHAAQRICECEKLCECPPFGDVEERSTGSHFDHTHWISPAEDMKKAALSLFHSYSSAFHKVVEAFWEPMTEEVKRTVDTWSEFLEKETKRQRKLAISQGRSPDHGPPCPPTPYRCDLRTVHAPMLARNRTGARR